MKIFLSMLFLSTVCYASNEQFIKETKTLTHDLKTSLMKNLSEQISKEGVGKAISFCHSQVTPIAKDTAKNRMEKFEFGRTSHKIRNSSNQPKSWADEYLKDFAGSKKGEMKKDFILHKLESGKMVYMEPLYVEAKCLLCHGENISVNVSSKLKELYPDDKATGFKLGEFRGFIWVKEK